MRSKISGLGYVDSVPPPVQTDPSEGHFGPDPGLSPGGFGGALSWSALASLLSGLGALGFLTAGRFAVGLEDFAPMAHVWTVWSVGAATVAFGAQIESVQGLAEGRGAFSTRHLRLGAIGAITAGLVTFSLRDTLFGTVGLFWPTICLLIPLGSLATGVARGRLAAHDRRRRLAFVIAGENAVRFAAALLVWWLGGEAPVLAISLLAGFSVALTALTDRSVRLAKRLPTRAAGGGAGAFAGLVAHACLVLPPSVLALRGEDPAVVAAVFLVLTYARAPYQFLLGLGPVLTAESFAEEPDRRIAWMRDGSKTLAVGLGAALAAALVGFLAGDPISNLVLGTTTIVSRLDYAILAVLVVIVATSIVRTLHILAGGGRRLVVRSWGSAAVVAVVGAFVPGEPTVLFGALAAAVALCLLQLTLAGGFTRS
jgi:hypothetical protein